jgi:hypothetical protein
MHKAKLQRGSLDRQLHSLEQAAHALGTNFVLQLFLCGPLLDMQRTLGRSASTNLPLDGFLIYSTIARFASDPN